jgi:8-oxo-dGTP diphosphatase
MDSEPVFGEPPAGVSCVERPAAYVCVFDAEGQVAVVLSDGRCFLPGGGSLPDETPEQTIRREVREELAREIRLLQPLGTAIQYFHDRQFLPG